MTYTCLRGSSRASELQSAPDQTLLVETEPRRPHARKGLEPQLKLSASSIDKDVGKQKRLQAVPKRVR